MTRPALYRTRARSGYRGVYFHRYMKSRPWKAYCRHHGTQVCVGYFATREEAALAYNRAVSRIRKTQYVLNDVKEQAAESVM